MYKAVLYNEEFVTIMIINDIISFSENIIENNIKDYVIESNELGTVNIKGSAYSIAFFDESIDVKVNQTIEKQLNQSVDKSKFIITDITQSEEIIELKQKIETLEGAMIEFMEAML